MAPPTRRSVTAVRAYSDHLHTLMQRLGSDPLDEGASIALVSHIVDNLSSAVALYDAMEARALGVGAPC